MNLKDAMAECGIGYFTLVREAKKGSVLAAAAAGG